MTKAEKWRTLARILAVTVPIGTLIGLGLGWLIGGAGVSMASGALIGFSVTTGFVMFDASWVLALIPRGWRESPFLVVLVTRSLVWLAVILFGISLPLLTVGGLSIPDLIDESFITSVTASFVAALIFNFVGQLNRLMGRRVLLRLILGRYHRPREEVRVFLLIDLRGSTQIANRLGNLRYHSFLRRFISDVTSSVIRYGAEVHRYIGDEVILTWTAERGLRDANCLWAAFAISDTLETARKEYETEFGVVPRFWAGLHVGPVAAGEIGTVKHEIAFLGDTLNVAARIEQACKELQHQFLVSADVVSAVDLPSEIACMSLGGIELRGVAESVELFAMTRVTHRQTTA